MVLQFRQVTFTCKQAHQASVRSVSFEVGAGEIVCVGLQEDCEDMPLLELATGLVSPSEGCVRYQGEDWVTMPYPRQVQARGAIGVLPEKQYWLANQTVRQNVLLRQRHHTTRAEADMVAEADKLAGWVGLRSIPRLRPNQVPMRELRMAGYVRACCGRPDLILLMCPEEAAPRMWPDALEALLQPALQAGSAVLVVSRDARIWQVPIMQQAKHYLMLHGVWTERT